MKNQQYNKNTRGFSLIEMAVVIAIMGILMTFGIRLATSFQNKGAFSATAERQKQIKDVLTAFLAREGRLPCPANTPTPGNVIDGAEVKGGAFCSNRRGLVPFATLGLPQSAAVDGWDRFFTYSVWDNAPSVTGLCAAAPIFNPAPAIPPLVQNWTTRESLPPPPLVEYAQTFHDGGDGCIKIEERDAAGNPQQIRRAVAAIVSHGPNGFGGYNSKAVQVSPDDATSDEEINIIDPDSTSPELFISRPIDINGFDDVVMGITANDLLNPLKRDGTIQSVKQLEREYLFTRFSVSYNDPNCELTLQPGLTVTGFPGNVVTIGLPAPYTAQTTIYNHQYGCPTGVFVEPTGVFVEP